MTEQNEATVAVARLTTTVHQSRLSLNMEEDIRASPQGTYLSSGEESEKCELPIVGSGGRFHAVGKVLVHTSVFVAGDAGGTRTCEVTKTINIINFSLVFS